jgi:hypothetical protein
MDVFFASMTLDVGTSLKDILDAFTNTDVTMRAVPRIFRLYIRALTKHRHTIFSQPSTSRLSYELHLAERMRDTIRAALVIVNEATDVADANSSDFWHARWAIWAEVSDWGGYLETDEKWSHILGDEADRLDAVLSQGCDVDTRVPVLQLLAVLESLDHEKTRLRKSALAAILLVGLIFARD